jgi:hypothetical protein
MKLLGEIFKTIYLPCGGQVCLLSNPLDASIFVTNHNLYRLDKNGDVIWQVQRNDKPGWAWFTQRRKEVESLNIPDEAGIGDCPFMSIWLQYADGSTNLTFGASPKTASWNQGCRVFCFSTGSVTVKYELDIDTGIATTVLEQMQGRPW